VPDAVFTAHVRQTAIKTKPTLWDELCQVATDLDVQKMELDVRMVEAHEWYQKIREDAAQS
jgi:hypothetical protein